MGEIMLSIFFALLGIAAVVNIQFQENASLSNTGATDFRTFPVIFGSALAVLSLLNTGRVVIRGCRTGQQKTEKSGKTEEENDKGAERIVRFRVVMTFLLSLMFAFLMKKIPFFILAFLFLFLAITVLGQKKLWINGCVALLGSGVIYLIFEYFLKLPL